MPPPPTLVCKQCGHVNEAERVYCHGCGSKLDREILVAQKKQGPTPQQRQRQLKKIMSPGGGGSVRNTLNTFAKMVLFGAVAAALIEAAQPPEWLKPAPKSEDAALLPLDTHLEKLVASTTPQRVLFRESVVNTYLKREKFKKVPTWLTNYIPMRRVFINCEKDSARLTLQADIFGYPLYTSLSAQVKADKAAGLVATCTGGSIGRLPIPASVATHAAAALPFLLDSFQHEQQLLNKIGSIDLDKEQIILGSAAPATPAPVPVPKASPGH